MRFVWAWGGSLVEVRYGEAWYGTAWRGQVWCGAVWSGLAVEVSKFRSGCSGNVWGGLVWSVTLRLGS